VNVSEKYTEKWFYTQMSGILQIFVWDPISLDPRFLELCNVLSSQGKIINEK
jgi:hypothetical protein